MAKPYPRINGALPGPKAAAIIARDEQVMSQNYSKDYPLVAARGENALIEDVDGNRFLDFGTGIAVTATGHSHPKVVQAVKDQAEKFIHMCYTDFYYDNLITLGERLARRGPAPGRWRVFFANTGAEVVEGAVKLARVVTGRQKLIAFYGAFHGRTYGAMSLTASKLVQKRGYAPFLPEVYHSHYANCYRCPVGKEPVTCNVECLNLLTDTMFAHTVNPDEVAAVIVEPVQGEGGYVVPHPQFLKRLRELTRKHGILLIADEVQSGMGRTGRLFASEHFDLQPDIVVVAKGIASGMPLAALMARADVMKWNDGGHGSTFGGNPVSAAAALATLDLLEGGLIDNAAKVGEHLLRRAKDVLLKHAAMGDVRGIGLMIGLDIVKDKASREPDGGLRLKIIQECFRRGLILIGCGKSTIRFAPPLTIDTEDADIAVRIVDEAMTALGV
ncbi:MAG TPA: acetyl ornithine aminotransferase family protein [Vicinamibacteria bacterium]|nr:acetyl ornithine aminotransferase family protein [Vicinamibacteria bacterium]